MDGSCRFDIVKVLKKYADGSPAVQEVPTAVLPFGSRVPDCSARNTVVLSESLTSMMTTNSNSLAVSFEWLVLITTCWPEVITDSGFPEMSCTRGFCGVITAGVSAKALSGTIKAMAMPITSRRIAAC